MNRKIRELLRKKGHAEFTPEEKRELCIAYPVQKIANSLKGPLQSRWDLGPHLGRRATQGEKYDYVLVAVREMIDLLMPDHEDKARKIYALVSWPDSRMVEPFGPVPTFEKLIGRECATCGGTGVAGFLVGRRCYDC